MILVREADAAAGLGFHAVRIGNRLKALVFGHWRQRFAFRTAEDWQALFERLGFSTTVQRASEGTPFANVLFIARRRVTSGVGRQALTRKLVADSLVIVSSGPTSRP